MSLWKKRAMGRYRYELPDYKSITYTVTDGNSGKVTLTDFLNDLHSVQLDCIDEALEKSDLKEANDIIAYIKGKL